MGSPLKRNILSTSPAHKRSCLVFTVTFWSRTPLLYVQDYGILLTAVVRQHFRTSPSCSEQGNARVFRQSPAFTRNKRPWTTGNPYRRATRSSAYGQQEVHAPRAAWISGASYLLCNKFLRPSPRGPKRTTLPLEGHGQHLQHHLQSLNKNGSDRSKAEVKLPEVIQLGKYLTLGFNRPLGRVCTTRCQKPAHTLLSLETNFCWPNTDL